MKLFSYKNDIVLDPFNEAGTTCLAARKHGRRFIGIDVSDQYCAMALKRVTDIEIVAKIVDENPYPVILTTKDLCKRK
jgi:site-specific DNA-methyltransferase (adenine-specific)